MIGALMAGFYTPTPNSHTVSANNCTFTEPYRTIAMCSACEDLTDHVNGFCMGSRYCNYTLPTGTVLYVDGTFEQQWMVANDTFELSVPSPPGSFTGREFIWTNGQNISSPRCTAAQESATNKLCANATCRGAACPVSAAGCSLFPCIRTYTGRVSNGVVQENLVSSVPLPPADGDCVGAFRKDYLTSADWTYLSGQGIHPGDDPGPDYILYCNADLAPITPACVYDMTLAA